MASLIADAKKDIDFKVVDAKEAELEEQDDDEKSRDIQKMSFALKGVEGTKQI